MKSIFIGHFRPTEEEFSSLWNECTFVVDANVLLNLYRYSSKTRKELEKALRKIKERVFIPHQAAKEFLRNRLSVTAGQSTEYEKTIRSLNEILATLSRKDRHPFLPDEELVNFKSYSEKLVGILEGQKDALLLKLTEDEILTFIEELFSEKTGTPYEETRVESICKDGEARYEREAPPGYKDAKKDSSNDPYRSFGDLIVWNQIIDYANSKNTPVIFITDDKKDDWWLEQSGRTISPRPELIEEFCLRTKQKFWMYTVDKFIQESATRSSTIVSEEILEEIIKIRADIMESRSNNGSSILISQDVTDSSDRNKCGTLTVTLTKNMKYATGTGKFTPSFLHIPAIRIELVDSPYPYPYVDNSIIGISYGCGTTNDFNVHLRAKRGLLEPGDYVFEYNATDIQSEKLPIHS